MQTVQIPVYRFLPKSLLIGTAVVIALLFHGCAPQWVQSPAPTAPAQRGPAAELISKGRQLLANGAVERAGTTFERAIRIEPRNPESWYGLARVRFAQHRYGQTIELCRKTLTLPAVDRSLYNDCQDLMAAAETKRK